MKRVISLTFFSLFLLQASLIAQKSPAGSNTVQEGTVTDSKTKEPLEGATIRIKGANVQTSTNGKGHFILKTSQQLPFVLQVTHIGYSPLEVDAGSAALSVQLTTTDQSLSDVVVVAYGTQKKITLTNAVNEKLCRKMMVFPQGAGKGAQIIFQ